MTTIEGKPGGASEEGGRRPLVLFALEPRSYSQAIAQVIAELRPNLEVAAVEPEELVPEMERRTTALVLCGGPRPGTCEEATRWARFRPYDDPDVVLVDGEPNRVLSLWDMVGLVDRYV